MSKNLEQLVNDHRLMPATVGRASHWLYYRAAPSVLNWSYEIDDHGLAYEVDTETPFLFSADGERCRHARLSPDSAYLAWENQYVLFGERNGPDPSSTPVEFEIQLVVDAPGEPPRHTITVWMRISPRISESWVDALARANQELLAQPIWNQLADRMDRLERWYHGEQRRRRNGERLVTAWERHARSCYQRQLAGETHVDRHMSAAGQWLVNRYGPDLPLAPGRDPLVADAPFDDLVLRARDALLGP